MTEQHQASDHQILTKRKQRNLIEILISDLLDVEDSKVYIEVIPVEILGSTKLPMKRITP